MDVSPAKRSYFTCANVWWKLLYSTRNPRLFPWFFFIFLITLRHRIQTNICSSDGQAVPFIISTIVIQKQYIQKSLKSLSACSDNSTSYIISHNPCECQQMLFFAFFVRPACISAYPFSNSSLNSTSDNVLISTGLADGIFTSNGSPLCKIICL